MGVIKKISNKMHSLFEGSVQRRKRTRGCKKSKRTRGGKKSKRTRGGKRRRTRGGGFKKHPYNHHTDYDY